MFRFHRRLDFPERSLTRMPDLSNITENLFGAIGLLRFEHLSHVIEHSSELCDMLSQGNYLLVSISHDIGCFV